MWPCVGKKAATVYTHASTFHSRHIVPPRGAKGGDGSRSTLQTTRLTKCPLKYRHWSRVARYMGPRLSPMRRYSPLLRLRVAATRLIGSPIVRDERENFACIYKTAVHAARQPPRSTAKSMTRACSSSVTNSKQYSYNMCYTFRRKISKDRRDRSTDASAGPIPGIEVDRVIP